MKKFMFAIIAISFFLFPVTDVIASGGGGGGGGGGGSSSKACEWNGSNWLICKTDSEMDMFGSMVYSSTGCIGLKNKKTDREVAFTVSKDKNASSDWVKLTRGQERKADFQGEFWTAMGCYEGNSATGYMATIPAYMNKVDCKNALEITKNKGSGGGCGCAYFGCIKM